VSEPHRQTSAPREFPLAGLVAESTRQWKSFRLFWWAFFALGVVAVLAGVYLALSHSADPVGSVFPEGVLLAVVGLVIALASRVKATDTAGLPTSLEVSGEDISFRWSPTGRTARYSWSDPTWEMTLFDRSGLPSVTQSGKSRERFELVMPSGKRVPITREAFIIGVVGLAMTGSYLATLLGFAGDTMGGVGLLLSIIAVNSAGFQRAVTATIYNSVDMGMGVGGVRFGLVGYASQWA
jgi:hypothetical protein